MGKWLVEVDVDRTKVFYSKDIGFCDCVYWENYMEACKDLDSPLMELFTTLGVIPSKPNHSSEFGELEDGLHLYIGSYHIVVKLVEAVYCSESEWNDTNTARMGNYIFAFARDVTFLNDGFPQPVLQLDFEARIPWVL